MHDVVCLTCGSKDSHLESLSSRDFPSELLFVRCGACRSTLGVVNARNLLDRYHRGDGSRSAVISDLLRTQPEALPLAPTAARKSD